MRRAEKEVKDLEQLEEILRDCNTVRIGTQDAEGMFIVPVNYGYDLTEGQLTLWPQRHGTDGFYICRMKRK